MQSHESPIPPFQLDISIKAGDIDELGHVNNVVYLSWVQDVAIAHWAFLTTPEHRARYAWVALRHEIDYAAQALPGDSITLLVERGNEQVTLEVTLGGAVG